MNKVTFVRSSSLNQWDYCQHSHFLTYTLGYQQDTNVKTEQGSAVHKVMEILANLKLFKQNNPDLDYVECTDEALGHVRYSLEEMREKTELTCAEVDAINKTRINKSVYMYDVQLPYGTIRWGVGPVTDLINRSSKYYSERSCGTWQRMDFKHVNNFTWIVLEHSGGEFDPRRNDIVSPEMNFVLPLEKPWAKLENGSHFAIKGTIDLIRRVDANCYEIVDYKTGRRLDWGTNTVKDYDYLCQDKQLMLYYYAASQLFPDKNIILTIFFIRDGGPFTICFDRDDLPQIEEKIKRYFFETNHTPLPILRDPSYTDFQCKTLCHFYKNKLPGTNDHICKFIHDQIKATDIDTVVEKYTREGHVIGHYEAPG